MTMSKELKVSFYLRKNEVKDDGSAAILGRIQLGKSMAQFSAKVNVPIKLWDTTSARALGKSKQALSINKELDKINVEINSHYKRLAEKSDVVTATQLKDAFQGIATSQDTLVQLYHRQNELFKQKVGINRTLATYKCHVVSLNHLKRFLKKKYNVEDVPFQLLDPSFIESYDHYLRIQLKFTSNTIIRIIGHLKHAVHSAINEGIITRDPFSEYTYQTESLKPKSLTAEELDKLMNTPLGKANLYLVRDMFLFSVFTGLAYSDVKNLTEDNLAKDADGMWWIHTKRQKTGSECHIPLLELPLQIIEKYRGLNDNGKLLVMLSCSKTNINLKKIAKICGIDKRVHYHQARHCYASLIMLSQGISMETTSKLLGHRDIRSTHIYARVSTEKINSDMKNLNQRLQSNYQLAD